MQTHRDNRGIGTKLRWLLIIDGILIMFVCIALLTRYVPEILRRYYYRPVGPRGPIVGELKTEAIQKGVAIQDIQLLPPRKIPHSDVWVVEIAQKDLEQEKYIRRSLSVAAYGGSGQYQRPPEFQRVLGRPTVNLLLFSDKNQDGFLLFDKQVMLESVIVPKHEEDPQKYILYTVIVADDNGDGRLSEQDNKSLWTSDLNGQDLVQITADSLALDSFSFSEDKQHLYLVVSSKPNNKSTPREHWQQAIYGYDMQQKQLRPLPIDSANFERARALLQQE